MSQVTNKVSVGWLVGTLVSQPYENSRNRAIIASWLLFAQSLKFHPLCKHPNIQQRLRVTPCGFLELFFCIVSSFQKHYLALSIYFGPSKLPKLCLLESVKP